MRARGRAIFGQQAGAAAVVMINNATCCRRSRVRSRRTRDDGEQFVVTHPVLRRPRPRGKSDLGWLRAGPA